MDERYLAVVLAQEHGLEERAGRLVLCQLPVIERQADWEAYNYRNHVQFHLNEEGRLGFHLGRSDEVLAIQECHLPEMVLNQVWPLLDFESIPVLERISLRLGAADDVQLVLESSDPAPPELNV